MLKRLCIRGILGITVLAFASCSIALLYSVESIKGRNISLALTQQLNLQNGDLIFRRGISIESQIVLLSDRSSEYSHVGLIYYLNGKPFVIHSVPAESNEITEYIKMESIQDFIGEENAEKVAIYRLKDQLLNKVQTASSFAYNCYQHKYSFDNDYDLNSNSQLYCTELIWKAYMSAGVDLVCNRLRNINFIITNKIMIMPSSIIESKLLQNIYSN